MNRQSGVALLTVLLLVAVMSVLVMSVLDDIRFGLRRASNAQSTAQAQWYALGAETLAMAQIDKLSARDPGRTFVARAGFIGHGRDHGDRDTAVCTVLSQAPQPRYPKWIEPR